MKLIPSNKHTYLLSMLAEEEDSFPTLQLSVDTVVDTPLALAASSVVGAVLLCCVQCFINK